MRFADRRQAGEQLGAQLARLDPPDPVVYALPRGGVPVAFEVSRALECPLDVLVVRKIGVPFQPELAMGAIGEGEVVIRNEEVIDLAGIDEAGFASVADSERRELETRLASYRSAADPVLAEARTAIVVDDGMATGSTALAAVQVLRQKGAASVWLAVPVAPLSSLGELERVADRIVVLSRPHDFGAVGIWYDDFTQTGDDEVRSLLAESRLA
ncbi:MAG TPA: phosphoribosyltransferase [Acidimicrobiia bacterium]|nr:phosphoribosyltransferase [Acidimicrobiia bacterium]